MPARVAKGCGPRGDGLGDCGGKYRCGASRGGSGSAGRGKGVESRSNGRRARCGRRHEQRRVFEVARTAASDPDVAEAAAGTRGEELLA